MQLKIYSFYYFDLGIELVKKFEFRGEPWPSSQTR